MTAPLAFASSSSLGSGADSSQARRRKQGHPQPVKDPDGPDVIPDDYRKGRRGGSGLHLLRVGRCLELALFAVAFAQVFAAPCTKVEESFSLQAVHDILTFGVSPSAIAKYDHVVFPGAVPRSFIGPLLLSFASFPLLVAARVLGVVKNSADAGLIIRLFLAATYVCSICYFGRHVILGKTQHKRPNATGGEAQRERQWVLLLLISALQFQPLFWAGRTTPNGIVMPLVIFALASIFDLTRDTALTHRGARRGLALLTAAAVISRLELVGVVVPIAVWLASTGRVNAPRHAGSARRLHASTIDSVASVAAIGALAGTVALASTVIIDTFFWRRSYRLVNPLEASEEGMVWPELHAIIFNVLKGKSSEWGTSPWHAYLTSHIPKLLSGPVLLTLIGMVDAAPSNSSAMLATCVCHVAIMSMLGHKEARFAAYLVPFLNVFAAHGASKLWSASLFNHSAERQSAYTLWTSRMLLLCIIAGTAALTLLSSFASANNYPGGQALNILHRLRTDGKQYANATVHIDVLPAMTGVSLFQSLHLDTRASSKGALGQSWLPCVTCEVNHVAPQPSMLWTYDKTEDLFTEAEDADMERRLTRLRDALVPRFTFLVSDSPSCHDLDGFARMRGIDGKILDGFPEFRGMQRKTRWPDVKALRSKLLSLSSGHSMAEAVYLLSPLALRFEDTVWLCERR